MKPVRNIYKYTHVVKFLCRRKFFEAYLQIKNKDFIILLIATFNYKSIVLRTGGAGGEKLSSGLRSGVSSLLAVKDSMPLSLCSSSSVNSTIMILHALIQTLLLLSFNSVPNLVVYHLCEKTNEERYLNARFARKLTDLFFNLNLLLVLSHTTVV